MLTDCQSPSPETRMGTQTEGLPIHSRPVPPDALWGPPVAKGTRGCPSPAFPASPSRTLCLERPRELSPPNCAPRLILRGATALCGSQAPTRWWPPTDFPQTHTAVEQRTSRMSSRAPRKPSLGTWGPWAPATPWKSLGSARALGPIPKLPQLHTHTALSVHVQLGVPNHLAQTLLPPWEAECLACRMGEDSWVWAVFPVPSPRPFAVSHVLSSQPGH